MEISWIFDAVSISEGENVSVNMILDRPPGIIFVASVIATDVNATGIVCVR